MAELGDFLVSSEDELKKIEAEQLDFAYVRECQDVDILRGIVAVLRSGRDGYYPELLEEAEQKLLDLLPAAERSKILRLKQQATAGDIAAAEAEILQWESQVSKTDENLRNQEALRKMNLDDGSEIFESKSSTTTGASLFPVRGSTADANTFTSATKTTGKNSKTSQPTGLMKEIDTGPRGESESDRKNRLARRKLREVEYNRLLNNKKSVTTSSLPGGKVSRKSTNENTSVSYIAESQVYCDYDYLEGLSDLERKYMSEREKNKGNEHFKASEHIDAFLCYTRSIIVDGKNAAAYSNRAIVNLKLNKLELAESDCNSALTLEGFKVNYDSTDKFADFPKSAIKMISRRGMARFRLGKYKDAIEDFYVAQHASSVSSAAANASSELEQLLKRAMEKYEEVEGKPYVLIRNRNKQQAAEAAAKPAPVSITINRMAPTSTYLFTFGDQNLDTKETPSVVFKSNKEKQNKWIVASEGALSPQPVVTAPISSPGGHFTRISISMSDDEDSESESEGDGMGNGFSRITITESDTEEDSSPTATKTVGTRIPIEVSDSESDAEDVGRLGTRIPIDMSDSESEEESKPAQSSERVLLSEEEYLSFKEKGNSCMRAKEYDEAIGWYSKCIHEDDALNKHSSYIASLNNRAAVYLELGQFDKSIADCTSVLRVEPSNVKAFYRRATAYERNSKDSSNDCRSRVNLLELGLKDVASVLSIERQNKQATALHSRLVTQAEKARSELKRVEQEQQEKLLREKEAADMRKTTPSKTSGESASWMYDVELKKKEAKEILSATGMSPTSKELDKAVSLLHSCQKTISAHRREGDTGAAQLDELELSVCQLLITTLRSVGACENEIVEVCTRAVELDTRNVKAYLRRAQANIALGKNESASVDLKKILKLDPYNNEVLGLLDQISSEGSSPEKAVENTNSSASPKAATPSNVTPLKEPSTPMQEFSPPVVTTPATPVPVTPTHTASTSVFSPGSPGASSSQECLRLKDLGNKATAAQNYTDAVRLYSESISHDPSHLASWSNRSQAYLKMNEWDHVISDCSHVISSIPATDMSSSHKSLLIKVYYRRACAHRNKYVTADGSTAKYLSAALSDISQLLKLDAANKPALAEKATIEKLLNTVKTEAVAPVSSSPVGGLSERSTIVRSKDKTKESGIDKAVVTPTRDKAVESGSSTAKKKKATRDSISNSEAAIKAASTITQDIRISSVPTEPPQTVVEFERHWKLLRSKPELFIHHYVLKVFKKSTYKKVIKTSVSDELMSYLLKHTYEQCVLLAPADSALTLSNSAFSVLKGIASNSDNLSLIVGVLSSQDLEFVRLIVKELEGYLDDGAEGCSYSTSQVDALKQAYQLG